MTAPGAAMSRSELPLARLRQGKVRDVYEVDADHLLLVATDRVSAFDVVMREAIPRKGAVLTQITAWWLRRLEADVPHHMISADVDEIVARVPDVAAHRAALAGRAMLCRRAEVVPIECVVRGYLSGSAWKEYRASGTLAGERLPPGLRESERLEPPLFSPATKAETGHDENVSIARAAELVGRETMDRLERLARLVYSRGRDVAAARGIIIADTKFEFGFLRDGTLAIVDEVLTPDSSRFWPADSYTVGQAQPSFDKQPLRDWLDAERRAGRWNGEAPAPALPPAVVRATSERYLDAYRRITGHDLSLTEPTT
jgi:phosphoribosylaminoimidazole-succinocarboxamide synthase